MPAPLSPFDLFLQGAINRLTGTNDDIDTLVRQMSFGMINLVPPPGQPSLLSQATLILQGIQALSDKLDTVLSNQVYYTDQILYTLAHMPASSTPVVLPSTPPAGYGANNSDIAIAVWTYILPNGASSGAALGDAYAAAVNQLGLTGVTLPGYPWIIAEPLDAWNDLTDTSLYPPAVLDARTILPTDTSVFTWANRTGPGPFGWTMHSYYSTSLPSQIDQNTAKVRWYVTMTPAQFASFQAASSAVLVPPVWPGIANVTLGTPLALSDGLTIPGPLDGVIVHITTSAYPNSYFPFGAIKSFVRIGGIMFIDDNGQGEFPQPVGVEDGVITPRQMHRADHAILRLASGTIGTITPWMTP